MKYYAYVVLGEADELKGIALSRQLARSIMEALGVVGLKVRRAKVTLFET